MSSRPRQNENFNCRARKLQNIVCETSNKETCFTWYGKFLYNILFKIVVGGRKKRNKWNKKSIHKILERSVLIGTFVFTLILRQIQIYLSVKVNT